MSRQADSIRLLLARGPMAARQLIENLGVSQPTVSRAIAELGDEIVRIGAGPSIQYALRDNGRGFGDIPVYRVDAEGKIRQLGALVPIRPDGFVMRQEGGVTHHSDGLPWWLYDMRPQGYLGRAYAARHAADLGLSDRLSDWSDAHAMRALLAHGYDVVGNILLGEVSRDRFIASATPDPILENQKAEAYTRLAEEAARGEMPGSSAGGEQPKFAAYAETPGGPRHVLVKFTMPDDNPVTERWRDLLLAEHIALETLRAFAIPAARTRIMDYGSQRFLEVERFDRIGALGRHGLFSLAALDAEFVGAASAGWPAIVETLARDGHIRQEAAAGAFLLHAFGTLIGNTDMHAGNLSFVSGHGRPYDLAPAYDMLPMGFAPRTGGGLPDTLSEATLHAGVDNATWREAEGLAREFLSRVRNAAGFSPRFLPCIEALERHIEDASIRIARLG